jgi:hypothetical protein
MQSVKQSTSIWLLRTENPKIARKLYKKQVIQCTSNETLWPVRVTIVTTKAAMLFLSTVVDLHVAVNNIKLLNVAMEKQERVSFALLSSYQVFCTAVNNIGLHTLLSPCKVPDNGIQF